MLRLSLPLLLLPLAPLQDAPRFAPEQGSSVTRTFALKISTQIDESTTLMNGDDANSPKVDGSTVLERTLTVTDEYGAIADGRPTQLKRQFDALRTHIDSPIEIAMQGMEMAAEMEFEGASPLAGQQVAFTWDADAQEYKREFVESQADPELLDELQEDLDLRALLPTEDDVQEGDSWDVEPAAFVNILFAGGDLAFELESIGDPPPMGVGDPSQLPPPRVQWDGLKDCSVRATLGDTRSDEGARLVVIALEVELEALTDMSEILAEAIADSPPEGTEIDVREALSEQILEGKGELVWNLTAGRAEKLTFTGDLTSTESQLMDVSVGGMELDIESDTSSSGTVELTVTFE